MLKLPGGFLGESTLRRLRDYRLQCAFRVVGAAFVFENPPLGEQSGVCTVAIRKSGGHFLVGSERLIGLALRFEADSEGDPRSREERMLGETFCELAERGGSFVVLVFAQQLLRQHEMGISCGDAARVLLDHFSKIVGGFGVCKCLSCGSLCASFAVFENAPTEQGDNEEGRIEHDLALVANPEFEWVEFGRGRGRRRLGGDRHRAGKLSEAVR